MLTRRFADQDPMADGIAPRPAVPLERPVATIVDTLASELAELAACGESLQHMASRVAGGARGEDLVADLQAVDLLVQRLNALSSFARSLAPSLPGEWRVDVTAATRALPLEETRSRLEGRKSAATGDAGECDFF